MPDPVEHTRKFLLDLAMYTDSDVFNELRELIAEYIQELPAHSRIYAHSLIRETE